MVTDHDDDLRSKSKLEELVEKVQKALQKPSNQRTKMTLIDTIQRLGVGHHFEKEIKLLLEGFSDLNSGKYDLFDTALRFRLLRHNGLPTTSGAPKLF